MNISFLNTSFLFALPLALVPLVLHLLSRKNRSAVRFSYVELIRRAAERTRIQSRLRRWLLLAVRTLLMAALVMFFARPVWRLGGGADPKKQSNAVVILVDASYSMGYLEGKNTRFEICREAAKKILGMLPPSARTAVICYSDRVESASPGLSNDASYLSNFIDGLKITNRTSSFAPAFNAARRAASQFPEPGCTVIVLSDAASHSFRDKDIKQFPGSRVVFFTPGKSENIWLNGLKAYYDDISGLWQLTPSAGSLLLSPKESWPIAYYQGSKKCGGDFINLENASAGTFSYQGDEPAVSFKAALAPDNLPADNVYYASARRRDPFKVWMIDGDPKTGGITSETYYLKTAFPSAETKPESASAGLNLTQPGVVILANTSVFTPNIESFIRAGGGALVFLGDRTPEEGLPEWLPASIGSRFEDRQGIKWTAPEDHYLSQSIGAAGFEFGKLYAEKGYAVQPAEGAAVLASFANGWPYLVEKPYGAGRVMLCATTADREWNNVPGRPVFPALAQLAVRYLAGVSGRKNDADCFVGDTARFGAVLDAGIITPSGKPGRLRAAGDELFFENTEVPGVYTLTSSGREAARLTVNLNTPSGESDLTAAALPALKGMLPESAVTMLPCRGWEEDLAVILSGKDASRHFLAAILLLLIAEILLANKIRK